MPLLQKCFLHDICFACNERGRSLLIARVCSRRFFLSTDCTQCHTHCCGVFSRFPWSSPSLCACCCVPRLYHSKQLGPFPPCWSFLFFLRLEHLWRRNSSCPFQINCSFFFMCPIVSCHRPGMVIMVETCTLSSPTLIA